MNPTLITGNLQERTKHHDLKQFGLAHQDPQLRSH